ncbi:Protein GST-6 [Aphelenchoides avenae]|nr:Protein GST-6 [Aphelenchus avenae]
MVHYKLTYFNVRNLAEASRMVLTYAGEPFEDVRLTMDEWSAIKPKTPHGKIPLLELDGKVLGQSQAIARYLARKFGLAGENDWERAKVDEVLDFQKDVYNAFGPYIYNLGGLAPGNKDELRAEFLKNAEKVPATIREAASSVKKWVLHGERRHCGGLLGRRLPEYNQGLRTDVIKQYAELEKFIDRVYSLPQLKKYISKRPETEFPI